MLTAFLGPLVVAGAFTAITKDVKLFYAMVFLIQFAMLGTFVAQDLFLFYLFWETMLIPMFLLIGIWGRRAAHLRDPQVRALHRLRQHPDAGRGDLPRLVAAAHDRHHLLRLRRPRHSRACRSTVQSIAARARSRWLRDQGADGAAAHLAARRPRRSAATAGSVILAGVMLKMGTYGFMKLGFPLFPRRDPAATRRC
mgnify:CR=1 FL=1